MKDQWIRDMRRLLDGYEKDPPDGLLDEVKQAIGERNLRPVPERKTRKIPLWLVRSVAAVAVAVGIGILVFHLPVTRERSEVQTAQESSRPPYRNGHTAIQQTESDHHPGTVAGVLASVERALSPRSSQGRKVHVLRSAPSSALLAKVNVPAQISSDHLESSVSIPSSGVSGFPENPLNPSLPQSAGSAGESSGRVRISRKEDGKNHQEYMASASLPAARHHRRKSVSIGPFCSGAMGGDDGSAGPEMVFADAAPYGPSESRAYPVMSGLVYGVDQLHTSTHYDQPVKLGLSLGYPVTDGLGLHVGIVYSLLSSDETRSNSTEEYKTHQKLHYVGLQLSASQSIWRKDHFHFYVTAGGGGARMVSGEAKTKYYVNDGLISTTKNDVKMHQLQWSVNGTAGVEYNFMPHVSLYVEPGISYYFKNGSQLHTYYRDKPLRPSLSIGLRFNIRDVGK